jgi:integration host factor subunit alpha
MTTRKTDLAAVLFEDIGFNKREALDMVDAFFQEVKKALSAGETVRLAGFGQFDLLIKAERPGRNPKTGVDIPISARRVVTFRAAEKLRASVTRSLLQRRKEVPGAAGT